MAAQHQPWLRLWIDMPNDPKWRTIAKVSKQTIASVMAVYLHVLCSAANATERGRTHDVCSEDVANAIDLETEQVDAILQAMQGRVLDGDAVSGWEKRQPAREDGSAERAKAWREHKKQAKTPVLPQSGADSGTYEANQTQANANERKRTQTNARGEERREEEIREEKNKDTHNTVNYDTGSERATRSGAVCVVCKSEGVAAVNPSHPDLLALLDAGAQVGQFADAARVAVSKGKGFAYVLGIVKGQMADAQRLANLPAQPLQAAETVYQRSMRERFEQATGTTTAAATRHAQPGAMVIDMVGVGVVQ